MKETHELCKVPWIGHKKGQSCLPRQRSLFHFPYPPRWSPGRQPGLTKTNEPKQTPEQRKLGYQTYNPEKVKLG